MQQRKIVAIGFGAVLAAFVAFVPSVAAQSAPPAFKTLYSFGPRPDGFEPITFGGGTDGAIPQAGVTIGKDGALFGTTEFYGGPGKNKGTVFALKP